MPHNRGYDGNRRWSAQEAEAQAEDTSKEKQGQRAHGKTRTRHTMAETLSQGSRLEPLGDKQASSENFKQLNAAFPAPSCEKEVRRLLEFHKKKLPEINDSFLKSLSRTGERQTLLA